MSVYRSAAACFEHTLNSAAADEPLKADARHNLELAKLLWMEEARKAKPDQPPSPNNKIRRRRREPAAARRIRIERTARTKTPAPNPRTALPHRDPARNHSRSRSRTAGASRNPADQNVAGNNRNLQVIEDKDEVQKLNPDEARAYMKETSKRRKRELHALLETLYGPDRPGVRDW